MKCKRTDLWAFAVLIAGLIVGCSGCENCEPRAETFCSEGTTYWANSCGDLEEIKTQCDCGCIADNSDCKLCDCESRTGKTCQDEVLYWTDSCGQLEEVIEACECGCEPDRAACKEDCVCVPSCEGKECGSDGCGDNHSCGKCETGWTCNDIGKCTNPGTCNNGQLETYEECEGYDLRDHTCQSQGFVSGILSCNNDCTLDTSGCNGTLGYCKALMDCYPACAMDGTEACDRARGECIVLKECNPDCEPGEFCNPSSGECIVLKECNPSCGSDEFCDMRLGECVEIPVCIPDCASDEICCTDSLCS